MSHSPPPSPPGRIVRSLGLFLFWTALVWCLLEFLWISFPYARNGTRIIVDAKIEEIRQSRVIPKDIQAPNRVVFFGNSKVLAGFVPEEFDKLSGGRTYSYNLGMPGETDFIPYVRELCRSGNVPTHVFLQLAWPAEEFQPTIWKWFDSDKPIVEAIFPFRSMARDVGVFLALAKEKGGISAFYELGRQSAADTIEKRGYYFIEAQSRFPNDQLPEDFSTVTDDPERVVPRKVIATGASFELLQSLAEKHDFLFYFVPSQHRDRYAAEPPVINEDTVRELQSHPRFQVVGPDYFVYPNHDFSDPVHLNREGAMRYTGDLWEATKQLFEDQNTGKVSMGSAGNDIFDG